MSGSIKETEACVTAIFAFSNKMRASRTLEFKAPTPLFSMPYMVMECIILANLIRPPNEIYTLASIFR